MSWLKDGKPLKADDHVVPFSLPDGSIGLKFSDVAPPDAAKYTAVLTNPGGDTADSSAPVEVTRKWPVKAFCIGAAFAGGRPRRGTLLAIRFALTREIAYASLFPHYDKCCKEVTGFCLC